MYWIMCLILAIGRFFDLFSTYYATPTFKLEINQWMKKVGWRNTIIINLLSIFLLPALLDEHFCIFLTTVSLLMAFRNFELSIIIRALGEDTYMNKLLETQRSAKFHNFLIPFLGELLICLIIGAAISAGPLNSADAFLSYKKNIGQGFIFFGLFLFILRFFEFRAARKQIISSPEGNLEQHKAE